MQILLLKCYHLKVFVLEFDYVYITGMEDCLFPIVIIFEDEDAHEIASMMENMKDDTINELKKLFASVLVGKMICK